MLKKGDHVVYGGSEICVVSDIVKRCFDGVNEENYLRLVPVETPCRFVLCAGKEC